MEHPTEDLPEAGPGETQKCHGWFSKEAKESPKSIKKGVSSRQTISNIYLNEEGKEVEVTLICREANYGYEWKDKEYRGVMVDYVRSVYR